MLFQPQSVIFDYGNVLSIPQDRTGIEAMASILGTPVALFEELYWRDRATFDEAAITPETYWEGIASSLARSLSDAGLERLTELDNLSWARPDPIMVRWAAELRGAGVRTAVISNMPITLRAHLQRFCGWLPEFDYSCYSCDLHQTKPAAGIFLHCLERLGVAPAEALFLDDREDNIDAARRLGMHAILFSSPEEAQCEINQQYKLPVAIPLSTNRGERASRSPSYS
jgi:putative hydrolase of the HAD superfamily